MRLTQHTPHCPMCGAPVVRTHRCTGRPAPLVPMPSTFREALAVALAEDDVDPDPELEQGDLLVDLDPTLAPRLLAQADAHRDRRRPRPWS